MASNARSQIFNRNTCEQRKYSDVQSVHVSCLYVQQTESSRMYLPALRLLLRLGHVETLLQFTSLFTFSGYHLSDDLFNTINEF